MAWGRNSEGQTNVPPPNSGFIAVAEAKRGQATVASAALAAAEAAWPEEFKHPGGFIALADAGELWFESADRLVQLRAEAEAAIAAASGSAP